MTLQTPIRIYGMMQMLMTTKTWDRLRTGSWCCRIVSCTLRPSHRFPVIVPVHRDGPVVAAIAAGADPGVALSVPRGNFWRKLLVNFAVVKGGASLDLILLMPYYGCTRNLTIMRPTTEYLSSRRNGCH